MMINTVSLNSPVVATLCFIAAVTVGAESEPADFAVMNSETTELLHRLETTGLTPELQLRAESLIGRYRNARRAGSESDDAIAEVQIHKLKETMRDCGPADWKTSLRERFEEFQQVNPKFDKDGNPEFQPIHLNRHAHYAGGFSIDGFRFTATTNTGFVWGFLTNPNIREWGILDSSGDPVRFTLLHFQWRSGWRIHPEISDPTDKIVLQTIPEGLKKDHSYLIWFQFATDDEIDLRIVYSFASAPENPIQIASALRFESKFEATKAAAERGDKQAQYTLGYMYQFNNAVPMNLPLALSWHKKAAEQGHADAANQIGNICITGMGVQKPDAAEGIKFYTRGAELGSSDAMCNLGEACFYGWGGKPDMDGAFKWYEKATKLGNVLAEGKLGYLYKKRTNIPEAFGCFYHAAHGGDPTAATSLGISYFKGEGTEANDLEAFRWLVRGHWARNSSAPYYLASLYYEGREVDRNYKKAFRIFKQGADIGEPFCQFRVGKMYYDGEAVTQDYVAALRYLKYAGQHKIADAAFLVGAIYENGLGTSKDTVESEKWYKIAADLGDENARQKITRHDPPTGDF
jgi:TPR repeat protein